MNLRALLEPCKPSFASGECLISTFLLNFVKKTPSLCSKSMLSELNSCLTIVQFFYLNISSVTYIWCAQFFNLFRLSYFFSVRHSCWYTSRCQAEGTTNISPFLAIFHFSNILVSIVTVFFVLFTPFCKRGQSVFLMDVMRGKITIKLKELHWNRKRRNTCTPEKS